MNTSGLRAKLAIIVVTCGLILLGSRLYDLQQDALNANQWPADAPDFDPNFANDSDRYLPENGIPVARTATATDRSHSEIKVRLVGAGNQGRLDLELIGRYRILGPSGRVLRVGDGLRGMVELAPDGLHLGPWLITANPIFLETAGDAGIRIGSRTYRGKLELGFDRGDNKLPEKLKVALFVPLEDYVLGVVCGEMPSNTPGAEAALRVQAIAARTYALWKLSSGQVELRDDTSDQHFESVDFETHAARAAVEDTVGTVLTWDGQLLPAWYHADCGGRTTPAHRAGFGKKDLPPLSGSADPFCAKGDTWVRVVAASKLDQLARDHQLGDWINRIQFRSRDRGGRLLLARLDGEQNSRELLGETLRAAFDLPSANWLSMRALADGSIQISGRGRGHGVGLCQIGSLRMSASGADVAEIMQHYYPGAALQAMRKLKVDGS